MSSFLISILCFSWWPVSKTLTHQNSHLFLFSPVNPFHGNFPDWAIIILPLNPQKLHISLIWKKYHSCSRDIISCFCILLDILRLDTCCFCCLAELRHEFYSHTEVPHWLIWVSYSQHAWAFPLFRNFGEMATIIDNNDNDNKRLRVRHHGLFEFNTSFSK